MPKTKSYESSKVHASPAKNSARGKGDPDFEFNSVIDKSVENASNNKSLADVLFSNGHLVPQANQLQTYESAELEYEVKGHGEGRCCEYK